MDLSETFDCTLHVFWHRDIFYPGKYPNKKESDMSCTLNMDQNVIKSIQTVKLLGVNIDQKLRLDFHYQNCVLKEQCS